MKSEKDKTVLIFGGAGFIGSNWAKHLLTRTDSRVHIYDNLSRPGVSANVQLLQELDGSEDRLRITLADVRDASAVSRAVADADEVYHFAAQVAVTTSIADPRLDFETNLGGTFNILDAVRHSGRRPFLFFTSTNKVYGELAKEPLKVTKTRYQFSNRTGIDESQPLDFYSPYGCSKGAAEQYVHDFGRTYDIPTVVFRMSCIAGEHQFGTEDQGWVAHFLYSALRNEPITIYGDGRQVRDVLYVGDLMHAIDAARRHRDRTEGQIFNIGGGPLNTVSLLELLDVIASQTGKRPQYVLRPSRIGDQLIYVTDHSKFTRATRWTPKYTAAQTLERLQAWYQENIAAQEREEVSMTASAALLPEVA
jgi:CDP-paratose 2-epimerase